MCAHQRYPTPLINKDTLLAGVRVGDYDLNLHCTLLLTRWISI